MDPTSAFPRDANDIVVNGGIDTTDETKVLPFEIDPATGRLLVDAVVDLEAGDIATEATLLDVLSELETLNTVDFATETTLASLEATDFATETTLALLEGKDFATAAKQDVLAGLIGEVQASPTANTVLDRLKQIQDDVNTLAAVDYATETTLDSLASEDFATEATLSSIDTELGDKLDEATFTDILGEVSATPTANTVLGRLKEIEDDLGTVAGAVAGTEMQVDVVAPLPAGTNNIGDVDVLSVPNDPFGANADAASASGSISAKLRRIATDLNAIVSGSEAQVDIVAPLPAGTNAIGKLAANDGVDIGDVTINNAASAPVYVASAKSSSGATTSDGVTVAVTSTTVLASNANRRKAIIVNDSDETVYLKLGTGAELAKGIRLNSSGGVYIEEYYTGAITGICDSGGKNVTVTELE